MGKKYKDIEIGDVYGRWTVIEKGELVNGKSGRFKQHWICKCSCDQHIVREVNGESLKNGSSTSCGCIHKEKSIETGLKQRKYNIVIGNKYKNWTVISYGKKMGRNTNTYLCECDCVYHTRQTLRADDIINNNANGCRKCHKLLDIIGNQYGDLTVLSVNKDVSLEKGRTYYNVKCKCGKIYPIRVDALTGGGTTNCGCNKNDIEDLTGNKYGMLTVIGYVDKLKYINHNTSINLWRCECDCGNIVTVRQGNITSGNSYSCGCEKRSHGEIVIAKLLKNWNIKYLEQYRFDDCRYKNTLPFDFAITNNNDIPVLLIEFDGEWHFKPIRLGDMTQEEAVYNLQQCKIRDSIKDDYCFMKNIPLVRINYQALYDGNLEYILFDSLVENQILEVNYIA